MFYVANDGKNNAPTQGGGDIWMNDTISPPKLSMPDVNPSPIDCSTLVPLHACAPNSPHAHATAIPRPTHNFVDQP